MVIERATLFNMEFINVYFIFWFHSFLNLYLRNVLILGTRCVAPKRCLFPFEFSLLDGEMIFFTHTSVSFLSRMFYMLVRLG